jgi:catechol 2,3-dioxygenase-like lactoylglutathione lyase family enzyme
MNRPGFRFSHFGMFVADLARQEDFYVRVLDFTVTDRGRLPGPDGPMDLVFLSRDPDEHHQLVLVSGRPRTLPFNPINQISLKADALATLQAMRAALEREGCADLVTVTHGNAVSIYVRDPEGNRLELYVDLPWYVSQPMRVEVSLDGDEGELMRRLEAHARPLPGFVPRAEWRAAMARRMGAD